jgi:hypothetical protein
VVIQNKLADPMANAGDGSFKFLPYQLLMVGYWPTMVLRGNGNLSSEWRDGRKPPVRISGLLVVLEKKIITSKREL